MNDELLLVDRWLEMKRHNEGRSDWTCRAYRMHLVRLQAYLAEHHQQTLLTARPDAIETFVGRHLHEQKVRAISRRVPVSAIRGFYAWLKRKQVLDDSPAEYLPSPHSGCSLPRPMQLASAEKLLIAPGLATFSGCRDTAILAVLISSGCRVSGIVNLTEEDLIWTQSPAGTERLVIRLTEKGKRERLVPIPLEASLLIRAYLGYPDLAEMDRVLPNGKRALFCNVRNGRVPPEDHHGIHRRLTRNAVSRMVRKYGEQCGIPKDQQHPHAIRHLYGTELAEEDVDVLQRMALLGHALPATVEVYTSLAMRKLATTVDRANPMAKMSNTPARGLANRVRSAGRSHNG